MYRNILELAGAFALAGVLASAPSSAFAQVSDDDKEETAVEAFESEEESRGETLAEAQSGPESDFSFFMDEVNIEEIERTETAIRRLRDLVNSTPASDPQRAEYMFRLAELYYDRTRYYEFRAYERRDEAFQIAEENPGRARAYERAAEDDLRQSENYAREAASLYGTLYSEYRDTYEDMDAVLFYLGSNFLQFDQTEAARQIFEELARNYPTSSYLPNAMLMLGELAFAEGDVEGAIAYYDVVIQSEDSSAYPYALYKKAWCLYNIAMDRGDYVEALELLYDAVEASRDSSSSSGASLTRQALRDVPLFYSEVFPGDQAERFFERIAPDTYQDLLERLALIYSDKALYDDSNSVYRQLIALNPESFRIVGWQTEIVRNTRPSASEVETVREIRRLVQLYNAASEFEDATEDLVAEVSSNIELLVRQVATTYHREAQVTQNEEFYALAYNLYEDYIANFPEGEHAYTMWFYYAELLYRNEDWEQAARAYERVLALSDEEHSNFNEDAVYASCLAHTKTVDLSESVAGSDGTAMQEEGELPPIPEPSEIPESYRDMMNACDRYLATGSTPEIETEIQYVIAYVYYDYNHLDEAARRFGELATTRYEVDADRAIASAELLLDSYALQREWGEMREWIEELQSGPINNSELGPRLQLLREQASFKECRDLQEAENFEDAAYCFFDFVNANLESELVDRAIYNAGISFREIDNLDYSISLFEQLPVLAPDSELVPDTLFQLGYTFHRLAVYETAAEYYEQYVGVDPEGENAVNAAANAADFRAGLGQYNAAIEVYESYMELAEDDPELGDEAVAEAAYQICVMRDLRGDGSYAIQAYDRFLRYHGEDNPSRAVEAMVRMAEMYLDRDNETRGFPLYERAVEFVEDLDAEERASLSNGALDAVSQAKFMLAEQIFEEFEEISLDVNDEEEIRERVTQKLELGREAAASFDPVIRVYSRPGWMIASLTRLGQMRHVFFEQLIDAPVPTGLDPLVAEEYRVEIESRAQMIKEEAIGFYQRAIEVAQETGWFNEYSELAARQLQELDPAFQSGSEVRIEPGFDSVRRYVSPYEGYAAIERERMETAAEEAEAAEEAAAAAEEAAESEAGSQSGAPESGALPQDSATTPADVDGRPTGGE